MPNIKQKKPDFKITTSYKSLLVNLKEKVRSSQIKAALSVNSQLITMYWELGRDIVQQQEQYMWGSDFINQLSKDLSREFPEMKGFSRANLYNVKKFFLFYRTNEKVQQLVGQIPWGHNLLIIEKIKDTDQAIWYIQQTIENGWSRNVLSLQIKSKLYERQASTEPGKVTNFANLLPKDQSDLAENILKDPYVFDFLDLSKEASEREIEGKLTDHIKDFLLELGTGFAFMGTQYHLEVGGDDFYIDMLFYHVKLRSYVVIELKTTKFKPEYAGKLNFYLSVVDDLVKAPEDNPTIGLLLCQDKNKLVAEYSLKDLNKPIGVSGYQLTETIPKELISSLPTIEKIEEEFNERVEAYE
tara:strand:- start:3155 stop:4222 length:1068 start_codon:yes stop_codon:yes gene_type:complete